MVECATSGSGRRHFAFCVHNDVLSSVLVNLRPGREGGVLVRPVLCTALMLCRLLQTLCFQGPFFIEDAGQSPISSLTIPFFILHWLTTVGRTQWAVSPSARRNEAPEGRPLYQNSNHHQFSRRHRRSARDSIKFFVFFASCQS